METPPLIKTKRVIGKNQKGRTKHLRSANREKRYITKSVVNSRGSSRALIIQGDLNVTIDRCGQIYATRDFKHGKIEAAEGKGTEKEDMECV